MANRASTVALVSCMGCLLLFSVAASCLASMQVKITIHNDAQIPENMLTQATHEAARIFRAAGVDSVWIVCHSPNGGDSDSSSCSSRVDLSHISLRVVPWSAKLGDSIFGTAFLSEKGGGAYSDVFYPSVEKLRSDSDASRSRLLGHVMAHEIGHLLLGTHSHSAFGIMQPCWQGKELQRIGMGTLLFTPEQARKMRARLTMTKSEEPVSGGYAPPTTRMLNSSKQPGGLRAESSQHLHHPPG